MGRKGSLTDRQAQEILIRLSRGETGRSLAAEFGVSPMTISNLKAGRTYAYLQPGIPPLSGVASRGSAARQYAEARFWAGIDRSKGTLACWPWTGARLANGYGCAHFPLPGGSTAFRTAFHLAHDIDAVPPGLVVRHLCGYKPCCNPAHLAIGTRTDNYEDGPSCPRPRPVSTPTPPPPDGWHIEVGDLTTLCRQARAEVFWSKVDTSAGPEGCWPWTGARGRFGHGNFRWFGRATSSGRVAYETRVGPVGPGLVVRHTCDHGDCCNPAHLTLGTQRDNRNDAKIRGRIPSGEKHHYGRAHPDAQVREIRIRHARGEPLSALAGETGVALHTVHLWVTGRTRLDAGGPTRPPRPITRQTPIVMAPL